MRKLSQRASRLIYILCHEEGLRFRSSKLFPEHVLLALIKLQQGGGINLLNKLHVKIFTYQLALETFIDSTNEGKEEILPDIPQSRRFTDFLELAELEAQALQSPVIGTEHLILAAIRENESITARYFEKAGLSLEEARGIVKKMQNDNSVSEEKSDSLDIAFQEIFGTDIDYSEPEGDMSAPPKIQKSQPQPQHLKKNTEKKSALTHFSRDLTELAAQKKSDPVIGREKEISRLLQVLSRRTKNNPVLVGEPGVGKTAIIEGLAQRLADGNVPFNLFDKKILSLDLTSVIAGTKYRGEFEERMKDIIDEARINKDVILFIDELHAVIGAGGPEGTMEASNILKPALGRGELQIIGATTTKEYTRYIEKDSAFERRFQKIKVEEPDDEDTIKILEGIKKQYEDYHTVIYDKDVIPTIVRLCRRYIPERCLPDKAIDILDEAGAVKKIKQEARPKEFDILEKQIEALSDEKKLFVSRQDYEKAALIRDNVSELKNRLNELKLQWNNSAFANPRHIDAEDIFKIVSSLTGIPVNQFDEKENIRLIKMEEDLHKSVIGQKEAVKTISGAIRRSRAGISSSKRPMGSFIFIGPTGVGKTQLAKALSEFLFGNDHSLIRIDMSDFMEKHNTSRLVGAPPGYIGYENGGILTEKVRQHPYSVVLLDEIEKAHPDVFNILLQILEEGELSDNLGHIVNFRNTVIIMTSNAGARQITNQSRVGFFTDKDGLISGKEIEGTALNELKKIMTPELLNRVDDIIVFTPLKKDEIEKIIDLQIAELSQRLIEKNLTITLKPAARKYLLEHGYEPSMGVRPLRRLIQREIEEPLSIEILKGLSENWSEVCVDCVRQKIKICIAACEKSEVKYSVSVLNAEK